MIQQQSGHLPLAKPMEKGLSLSQKLKGPARLSAKPGPSSRNRHQLKDVAVKLGAHFRPILSREAANFLHDKPVIQSEELEPDNTGCP